MSGKTGKSVFYTSVFGLSIAGDALAAFVAFHWLHAVWRLRRLERKRSVEPTVSLMAEYKDIPTQPEEKS